MIERLYLPNETRLKYLYFNHTIPDHFWSKDFSIGKYLVLVRWLQASRLLKVTCVFVSVANETHSKQFIDVYGVNI